MCKPSSLQVLCQGPLEIKMKGKVVQSYVVLSEDRLDFYKDVSEQMRGKEPRSSIRIADVEGFEHNSEGFSLRIRDEKYPLQLRGLIAEGTWVTCLIRRLGCSLNADCKKAEDVIICRGALDVVKRSRCKSRYFVLYSDRLEYFAMRDEFIRKSEPLCEVSLNEVRAVESDGACDIVLKLDEQREWLLRASDPNDAQKWADAWRTSLFAFPTVPIRIVNRAETRQEDEVVANPAHEALCEGLIPVERSTKNKIERRYVLLFPDRIEYYGSLDDLNDGKSPRARIMLHDVHNLEVLPVGLKLHALDRSLTLHLSSHQLDEWGYKLQSVVNCSIQASIGITESKENQASFIETSTGDSSMVDLEGERAAKTCSIASTPAPPQAALQAEASHGERRQTAKAASRRPSRCTPRGLRCPSQEVSVRSSIPCPSSSTPRRQSRTQSSGATRSQSSRIPQAVPARRIHEGTLLVEHGGRRHAILYETRLELFMSRDDALRQTTPASCILLGDVQDFSVIDGGFELRLSEQGVQRFRALGSMEFNEWLQSWSEVPISILGSRCRNDKAIEAPCEQQGSESDAAERRLVTQRCASAPSLQANRRATVPAVRVTFDESSVGSCESSSSASTSLISYPRRRSVQFDTRDTAPVMSKSASQTSWTLAPSSHPHRDTAHGKRSGSPTPPRRGASPTPAARHATTPLASTTPRPSATRNRRCSAESMQGSLSRSRSQDFPGAFGLR